MGYTTDGKSFDSLSQHISVFLSGHLHKLAGGLGNILHAQHPNDLLELELADLKQHGSYRVIAIDNDLISFVDGSVLAAERRKELERRLRNDFTISEAERRELLSATVGDDGDPEPLVLITNPKDSRYLNRRHEPTARIRRSTHIRFLVFSNREISRIELTIDGKKHVNDCKSAQKASGADMPLYVCRWDPAAAYDDKQTHQLTVRAWDDGGRRGEHSVRFRLDGDRQPLNIGFGEIVMTARYSLIVS
jgi:hypothetical protein